MKQNKGVTLIALVITIVVLLILAGVALNVVLDPTNIIGKAEEAKVKTNRAVAKEELQTAITLAMLETEGYNQAKEDIIEILENLGATCTENGSIYDIEYKGNNFILAEDNKIEDVVAEGGITAADVEADASYIGEYVNYGGQETFKGVKWRIFNAENGKIQLIADYYIHKDVMPAATNILIGKAGNSYMRSDFCVNSSDSRKTLIDYINTESNWSDFIAVTGAKVTGGPTIEQFKNSYNRTHGKNSEATVKEIFIAKSSAMDDGLEGYYVGIEKNPTSQSIQGLNKTEMENLYVIDEEYDATAYWLGSACVSEPLCLVIVNSDGSVSFGIRCYDYNYGLRPLVTLPSGTTLIEQANGTYSIKP